MILIEYIYSPMQSFLFVLAFNFLFYNKYAAFFQVIVSLYIKINNNEFDIIELP